ncbi:hypothetical protein GWM83_03730, partial [Candidatus Bathyarchaeota archaeon]|nr:hypothetical protein [Candidatus Bathyarchaeota archaeon]
MAKQAILEDEEAQVERAKARGENAAALRFISPESQRGLIDLETGNDPSKRLTVKDLKDNQDRYAYVDPNIKDVDRNLRTQLPVLEKIMSLATKIFTD